MKITKAVLSSMVALLLIVVLDIKFGQVPPLGKFLDPYGGFWQNAENKNFSGSSDLKVSGLNGNTEILFDDHRIPHIFAGNNHDAYFAQGYITARDRLWQMDFQTRFAAGRLSEVVGVKALELDKYQRRMGMVFGAENMVKLLETQPELREIITAYTEGINEYVSTLDPKDYPIEFKILDYKPEKWSPLNTALLLKMMSATLAGGSNEFYMTNILRKFGPEVVNDLFPDYPFRESPIIPVGTKWDFKPLPIPPKPAETGSALAYNKDIRTKEKDEGTGSNNWAVSAAKSATGYPILANDPHLDLSLPAIWYQIQITTPDMNVRGVSIPGAPCVIIGYNQQIAWGVTNVGADVLDWYSVQFKDSSKKEYWYNNRWNPVKPRTETIKVRGSNTITDTVYYTHQGPVVYLQNKKPEAFSKAANVPAGYALRWVAHDPATDLITYYLLNKAKNYADYRKALEYSSAPAQNFIFASNENDIAITTNGYFPLKWKDQGKFLLDGTNPANEWHGRIPANQNPTVKNPPRGFVSSANEFPTDQTYPYYLNWEFAGYERAQRINNRLTAMTNVTVDSMRSIQNDNYSILAENILPAMVAGVNTEKLNATEHEGYRVVSKWNKIYDAGSIGASIFEIWQKEFLRRIWVDELGDPAVPMRYPSRDRSVQLLLTDPDSHWFDDIKTAEKETAKDIIQAAFKFTIDSLQRGYGQLGQNWQWGKVKHTNVPHLAKIAGFGSKILENGGSKSSVNALAESNGPSWRMVVQLGKDAKGYGIFPGGQSGNPGSFYYDDMIDTWSKGKLDELLFLKSKDDSAERIKTRLTLIKK